jgi:hypothetical protein
VVTVPGPITAEATGPGGAVVTFAATASDGHDGDLTPTCAPPSGSTFALGATSVTCTAEDAAGNEGSASFTVTVQDTIAPAVTWAGPLAYTVADTLAITCTATDSGSGVQSTTCAGITGPAASRGLGTHTASATARDVAGNVSPPVTVTFTVTVSHASLCTLSASYSTSNLVDRALCATLEAARVLAASSRPALARAALGLYTAEVTLARVARVLTSTQASTLTRFARSLS